MAFVCAHATHATAARRRYAPHTPVHARVRHPRPPVHRLSFYWNHVPGRSRFAVTWACWDCAFNDGRLWAPLAESAYNPQLVESYAGAQSCKHDITCLKPLARSRFDGPRLRFPGFFVFHGGALGASDARDVLKHGVPDHTWAEVIRVSVLDDDAGLVGFVWFWQAMGSGIWLNTGRSLRLVGSRSLAETIWQLDPDHCLGPGKCGACEKVRAMGYDTVQLTQFANGYSLEILDCRGADRPDGRDLWPHACPPPHIELLQGVPEVRYAPALEGVRSESHACSCDLSRDYINCNGSPAGDAAWVAASPHPPPPPALPHATWTAHHSKNCYAGRGAVSLGHASEGGGMMLTVEDCQDACVRFGPGCTGLTIGWNREVSGMVLCWLRRAIQLQRCMPDAAFSTYIRGSE